MIREISERLYNNKYVYILFNLIKGRFPLFIEPYFVYPRWKNGHKEINSLFEDNTLKFKKALKGIRLLKKDFISIEYKNIKVNEPRWVNGFFPALEGMSLYFFISSKNLLKVKGSG